MTQRAEALATAFEQAATTIVTAADGLSDTSWDMTPDGEARTAGQIVYHLAEVYVNISNIVQLAIAEQPLPALTMEIIHSMNAEQAIRYADVGRERALELFRQNSAAMVSMVRSLNDSQFDTDMLFLGIPMTVESLVQNALVEHTKEHLASIIQADSLASRNTLSGQTS